MINSVTKPSTQDKAAINNFEEMDLDLVLTFDTYLFYNFNGNNWRKRYGITLERSHNFWRALIGIVDMKLHHNQNGGAR